MNPHLRRARRRQTWTRLIEASWRCVTIPFVKILEKGLLYAPPIKPGLGLLRRWHKWSSSASICPAISVRDIQVKDDESCMCSDLVGRVRTARDSRIRTSNPLRQGPRRMRASAYYSPEPGFASFGTNDPTLHQSSGGGKSASWSNPRYYLPSTPPT